MKCDVLLSLPLLDLLLADMPQLVHRWALSRRDTLGQLDRAADDALVANCILDGASFDSDDGDSRVLWAAVMCTVTQVTNPSF